MNAKTQVETAEKVGVYPFDPTFWAQKANMEVKIQAQVERRGSPRQWHTGKTLHASQNHQESQGVKNQHICTSVLATPHLTKKINSQGRQAPRS